MHSRLGDLLHPKRGLKLGIADDPWYSETRNFLNETAEYLMERYKGNTPFFTFVEIEQVEMIRVEEAP